MSFIQVYLLFACMFWNKVAIDFLVSFKKCTLKVTQSLFCYTDFSFVDVRCGFRYLCG